MKTILSLRRYAYLKTISIFLIAVVLICGVVGCEGEPEVLYEMSVGDCVCGDVIVNSDTLLIAEGEIIIMEAVADDCCRFVDWQASAGTFGDANNATTTFTMPAQDVTITANFELVPPDHYKFYDVDYESEPIIIGTEVLLEDQFGTFNASVLEAISFGNPVQKEHDGVTPISDDSRHYTIYRLELGEEVPMTLSVEVSNQFQEKVELLVRGPVALAVPTQKEGHEMAECLNHYLLYYIDEIDHWEFLPVAGVNLKDQFIPDGEDIIVRGPWLFANPVKKTVIGGDVAQIEDPDLHWVLYDIWDEEAPSMDKRIQIANQFGNDQILDLTQRNLLAVPSEKIDWEPLLLNHFQCFQAGWNEPEEEVVELKDQFHDESFEALLGTTICFCAPTEKLHDEVLTPILYPDHYLMVYSLSHEEEPQEWSVEVDNQFGQQMLIVSGPVALAVPTQREGHEPPVGLDHFLLYEVIEGTSVNVSVTVQNDLFGALCVVELPAYFACPVQKKHGTEVTEIQNPEAHLVLYQKSWTGYWDPGPYVHVFNQFVEQESRLYILFLLGVPSEKIEWSLVG